MRGRRQSIQTGIGKAANAIGDYFKNTRMQPGDAFNAFQNKMKGVGRTSFKKGKKRKMKKKMCKKHGKTMCKMC